MLTFKVRWQYYNHPGTARTEIVRAGSYEAARQLVNRAATRTEHVVIIKIEELMGDAAEKVRHLVTRHARSREMDEATRDPRNRRRRGQRGEI
jgi:hypothetical protein